jgi:hypothetical protein
LQLIHRGRLVEAPTPADLAVAALRRITALTGPAAARLWAARSNWLKCVRGVAAEPWRGRRLDLVRYSGPQRCAIAMQGVAGALDRPDGPVRWHRCSPQPSGCTSTRGPSWA